MGGLWLASLMAGAETEQNCETNPAAELMRLKSAGTHETNDGLPRKPVVDLGQKDLALRGPTGISCQEFALGEFLVELCARSCFQQWQVLHPASEDRCTATNGGEKWSL